MLNCVLRKPYCIHKAKLVKLLMAYDSYILNTYNWLNSESDG